MLEDTHLSNSIDLTVQGDYNELCIEDSKRVNIFKKKISTAQLANRMVTQKFAIELLPNDL